MDAIEGLEVNIELGSSTVTVDTPIGINQMAELVTNTHTKPSR